MFRVFIGASVVMLLAGQACADKYDSMVPDWTYTREMEQGKEPSFFAYMDQLNETAGVESRASRIDRYDQSWVDSRYWCDSEVTLDSRDNSAVFQEIPTGKNFFALTCHRGCDNIKFSVAASRNIVIGHSGLQHEFPHIWVPGPTTYFHSTNIGFIAFDDGDGASPDRVQTQTGRPTLSGKTEITIKHWRPH